MEYNTGNYDKYMSNNPLKRKMVARLNEKIVETVQEAVGNRTGEAEGDVTILDAGCGEGFIMNLLNSRLDGGVSITGLELTDEAIRFAQEMNPENTILRGGVCNMPFEPGTFDIVLCTEVLEHLKDPSAALSELIRVSKETVIVTVPHEPWFRIGNMLALKNVTRFGNPIDHINHWTYSAFSAFLRNHSKQKWEMSRSFPWTIARCTVNDEKHRENSKQ